MSGNAFMPEFELLSVDHLRDTPHVAAIVEIFAKRFPYFKSAVPRQFADFGPARATGALKLIGEYIPTTKNEPVADLYPSLGFTKLRQENGRTFYAFDLAHSLPENRHVNIV